MNELGASLLGATIRISLLAAAAVLACRLARRRGAAASSYLLSWTMPLLLVVQALAFFPWPAWWRVPAMEARLSTAGKAKAAQPVSRPLDEDSLLSFDDLSLGKNAKIQVGEPETTSAQTQIEKPKFKPAASALWDRIGEVRWTALFAGFVLVSASIGLMRVLIGLFQIHKCLSASTEINDAELIDQVEILRAETSCRRTVAVRESKDLGTPATVGWRKPALLLPEGWKQLTAEERQAVLAHEIAHVARNDYLAGLVAQTSLALQFHNPLVHWLLRALRFEQELAADAWGARLSGGRARYLQLLAHMALRDDPVKVNWPARAFLPGKGAFLRRIQMLRDDRNVQHFKLSRWAKGALALALLGLGISIAGLADPPPSPRRPPWLEPKTPTAAGSTT